MASLSRQGVKGGETPTATVVDFICLFTHDLKRKQKRWQDGVLKYHTFNKRIMVHDDRGHFVGDAHWQAEGHLDTGDEFELDRGGAIVQVSDCTGQREQDLSELLDKRSKEVEKRRATAISRTPRPSAQVAGSSTTQEQNTHFQLRHRPLSEMLGTPSRIGRAAISPHSPYEARQMAQGTQQEAKPRTVKKRRHEESPPSTSYHARALFGATLTLTPLSQNSRPSHGSIQQKWANTDLKSLLSVENDQTTHFPNDKSDPIVCQSDEIAEIMGSHALPTRVSRKPPKSTTSRPNGTNKPAAKPLDPSHHTHQKVVTLDDFETETAPQKPAIPRMESKTRPKRVLTGKTAQPAVQEIRRDVIVIEDGQTEDSIAPNAELPERADRGAAMPTDEPTRVVDAVREAAGVLPSGHGLPQPIDKPMTELRIRSRQRRGLLLMSERKDNGKRSNKKTPVSGADAQSSPNSDHPKRGDPASSVEEPGLKPHHFPLGLESNTENEQSEAAETVSPTPTPITKDGDSPLSHVPESSPHPQPVSPRNRAPTPDEVNDTGDSDDVSVKTRASRRPRKRPTLDYSSEDGSEDMEPPRASKRVHKAQPTNAGSNAFRITKMARKSIKSKEIIGFVMPDEEPVFRCPPFAARPTSNVGNAFTKTTNADEADLKSHKHKVQLSVPSTEPASVAQPGPQDGSDSNSISRPAPRLRNPASRGKKAAKKEDAAGQLPQTLVQLEPTAPTRVGAPKAPSSRNPSISSGFTTANGGAWSVHAEDLLGMTRPANKPS